jgi:16S rRNA (uracil1498-N3)-methyltransferase
MPRFFVPAAQVSEAGAVLLDGDAAHLARSLRATVGERLVLVDDAGREHGVRLLAVSSDRVEAAVEWTRPATGEPRLELHVVQALAKEGMDDVVEALAEVGAAAIWPVLSTRSVARPDPRRAEHRVERWQAIARNAAGLAGRARVPQVHPLAPLADAVRRLPAGTRMLACAVDGEVPLAEWDMAGATRVAVCIGPEGGFSPEELAALRSDGATMVHMGPRVLRARLAGVAACAVLLARAGDMHDGVAPWPDAAQVRA